MTFTYEKSHTIFDSGSNGPLFVAPHAGNAFHKPGDFQDTGTHFIAQKLATVCGGRALVSNVSRERDIGVDFYRHPPAKKHAIEYYTHIVSGRTELSREYRKKYAWVAKNSKQHAEKKKLYGLFWNVIKKSDTPVYFIHRQFLNPVRHPSLIDIVSFTNEDAVKAAVEEANKKYSALFQALFPFYKKSFYFKSNCVLYKDKLENNFGIKLFRDFEPRIITRIGKFNEEVKKKPFVKLTYRYNFGGEHSTNLIKAMLPDVKHPVVQFEVSEFLTLRVPDVAVQIIGDIIKRMGSRPASKFIGE